MICTFVLALHVIHCMEASMSTEVVEVTWVVLEDAEVSDVALEDVNADAAVGVVGGSNPNQGHP